MVPAILLVHLIVKLGAPSPAGVRARDMVTTMSLDEKISLTHGTGWGQDNEVGLSQSSSNTTPVLAVLVR